MQDWEKTILLWIVLGLLYTGYQYLNENKTQVNYYQENYRCTPPDNPYSIGTGHYAGFEWGLKGNSCRGNSNSFIEGCEEYHSQESKYIKCSRK